MENLLLVLAHSPHRIRTVKVLMPSVYDAAEAELAELVADAKRYRAMRATMCGKDDAAFDDLIATFTVTVRGDHADG